MESGSSTSTVKLAKAFWMLVVAALVLYVAGTWKAPLFDRDEPRFAEAAREMLHSGDYVVPRFNGEIRYDKPILSYYPMALGMAVFGENEFGARVFNCIFGALTVVVVFSLARSITGTSRVALVAAAMLATAPVMAAEAKQCTADALLVFLLALTCHGLWKIYEGPCGNRWKFIFWAALALAVLTKGPVALAAAFGAVFFLIAISRDRSFLGRMAWPWGVPLFVLVVAPWLVAVQERTGGEFLDVALGRHVLDRSYEPLEGHGGPPGYYVFTMFVSLFPWAFFLPGAAWDAAKGLRDRPKETFLLSWMAGLWVILELAQTKMMHYSLPVFPAAVILVAQFMVRAEAARDRRLLWGIGAAIVMAVIIAVALPSVALMYNLDKAVQPLGAAGAVLLLGMAVWLYLLRNWHPLATGAAVATSFAWLLVLSMWAVPAIYGYSPSKQAARRIEARRDTTELRTVGLYGYREPSLVFYLGGAMYAERPASIEELYLPGAPDILVLSRTDRGISEMMPDTDFDHVGTVDGFNFAKGRLEHLGIWARPTGPPATYEPMME